MRARFYTDGAQEVGLSSLSRYRVQTASPGQWLRAWPLHPVRLVMLAALPLAVLVGSPQRVALSAVIAAGYVLAAAVTQRGRRVSRILILYIGVVAAWMVLSWLRSRYLLHLSNDQLSYATSN